MKRNELLEKIAGSIQRARVGDTLYIFDKETAKAVEKEIRARVTRTGESVIWPSGVREWVTYEVAIDTTKEASKQFTWDKKGMKVLHHRVRHILYPGGRHGMKTEGHVFRTLD